MLAAKGSQLIPRTSFPRPLENVKNITMMLTTNYLHSDGKVEEISLMDKKTYTQQRYSSLNIFYLDYQIARLMLII